jgi:hypothetical protein
VNWAAHWGQVRRTGFPGENGLAAGGGGMSEAGKVSGESQTGQGRVWPAILEMNGPPTFTTDLQTPQVMERSGMFKSFRRVHSSVLFRPKRRKAEAFYLPAPEPAPRGCFFLIKKLLILLAGMILF